MAAKSQTLTSSVNSETLVVGRITGVHGVKGWLKIHSYTDPESNLFDYSPWTLQRKAQAPEVITVEQFRRHSKGFIVLLPGCSDRAHANMYTQAEIVISKTQLPPLKPGEYYWQDLEQLDVYTTTDIHLGQVDSIMATGANDVLVVQGEQRHLIPFIHQKVIKKVDMSAGLIQVDWDPDF